MFPKTTTWLQNTIYPSDMEVITYISSMAVLVLWFFLTSFVPIHDRGSCSNECSDGNSQAQQEGHALMNALGSYLLVAHSHHDQ